MPASTPGRWFAAFARRVTRDHTFTLLVAPAIADLQREPVHDWRRRGRHYPALMLVLAIALLRDLGWRLTETLGRTTGGTWAAATAWYLACAVTIAGAIIWTTPLHLLGTTGQFSSTASAFIVGLLAAMPLGVMAAVFHLRRRQSLSPRAFAAATAGFIVIATVAHVATLPIRSALNRTTYSSVSSEISREAVLPDDPRQQYLAAEWRKWATWRASLTSPVMSGVTFQRSADPIAIVAAQANFMANRLPIGFAGTIYAGIYAMTVAPWLLVFGLCGVALSHGRGLTVLLRAVGLVASTLGLQLLMLRVFGVPYPLVVMLVVATAWTFYNRLPWWRPETCPVTGSPR